MPASDTPACDFESEPGATRGDLAGQVAVVTGASKGIGAGIARAFGAAGARVAVAYARDLAGAERVVADIEASGGTAIAVQADLAEAAEVGSMIVRAADVLGPISCLVNNAGVFDYRALADIDEPHFHTIMNTNVLGLLMTTKHAVAHFAPGGGSIINISSLSATGHTGGRAVYAAAKAR